MSKETLKLSDVREAWTAFNSIPFPPDHELILGPFLRARKAAWENYVTIRDQYLYQTGVLPLPGHYAERAFLDA